MFSGTSGGSLISRLRTYLSTNVQSTTCPQCNYKLDVLTNSESTVATRPTQFCMNCSATNPEWDLNSIREGHLLQMDPLDEDLLNQITSMNEPGWSSAFSTPSMSMAASQRSSYFDAASSEN